MSTEPMSGAPNVALGRSFDAYQSFVLATKMYWTRKLYPALHKQYLDDARTRNSPPASADAVAEHFQRDVDYALFGWFERHLQQLKYCGHHGLLPVHEAHRQTLERCLETPLPDGLLTLDDDLVAPDYFTRVDIHQHPGGVCGDSLAGIIYERGARSTTPMLDRDLDLHFRFTKEVRAYLEPTRIVDLGCGFGKSTQPFYLEFKNAQTLGIDVSAPCLKLAAVTAAQLQATNTTFKQGRAEHTGLPDSSRDLVTSTMLLHEMPARAVREVLSESYRLLEPGGWAIHLDFLAEEDAFARFTHYGHARRNNEPYMRPLNEMNLASEHAQLGFSEFNIVPFEEYPDALASDNKIWRFPWVVIAARK